MDKHVEIIERALIVHITERMQKGHYDPKYHLPQKVAQTILRGKGNVDRCLFWTDLANTIQLMGGSVIREDIRSVCHSGFTDPSLSQGSLDFIQALKNVAKHSIKVDLERFM